MVFVSTDYESMNDYQEEAHRTELELPLNQLLVKNALGLCGEAGELAEIVKKHAFHGRELDSNKLAEELGDVLWYLSQVARAAGISLNHVAIMNVRKLRKRYPNGYSHAAHKARVDAKEPLDLDELDDPGIIKCGAV